MNDSGFKNFDRKIPFLMENSVPLVYPTLGGGVQISLVKDTGAPVNILPLHLLEKFEGEMIFPACASCAQSHFPVIQTHP